jgi:hypothetical protein
LTAPAEENIEDVPSEISAELLANRLGEYDEEAQQDDEALSQLKSSIFLDEFDEISPEESDEEGVYTNTPEFG